LRVLYPLSDNSRSSFRFSTLEPLEAGHFFGRRRLLGQEADGIAQ
jgi:hypothetical protein